MLRTIQIIQVVLAALLVAAILMQSKGTGIGGVFGGGEGNIYRTKRGAEKVLFISTIVMSVLFFAAAFVSILIRR